MPKSSEVAAALRSLADSLESNPDANICQPYVYFSPDYDKDEKEKFLSMARLMPRPVEKNYTDTEVRLEHRSPAMVIISKISRSEVCRIVEPARAAVYDCVPLLSIEEDAQLTAV